MNYQIIKEMGFLITARKSAIGKLLQEIGTNVRVVISGLVATQEVRKYIGL